MPRILYQYKTRHNVRMSIPKITHQIWLQGWSKVPEKFQENIQLLRSLNPDYTHMTWDETSLRQECMKLGQDVAERFDSFPYLMQKVDLGRYVVIYNYGGISVDTDMKSLRPISETPHLDTDKLIVSYSAFPVSVLGFVNNAMILAKKYNPVLLKLIQSIVQTPVKESDYPTKEFYIDASTSPSRFNTIIFKYKENVLFLDHRHYEPCFSVDPVCRPNKYSIMDHKHELSWFHGTTKHFVTWLLYLLYLTLFVIFPIVFLVWFMIKYFYPNIDRGNYGRSTNPKIYLSIFGSRS